MQLIRPDKCPMSGHPMAERQRKDGSGTFLACTGFPECKYIWKDLSEIKPSYRKTPTTSTQIGSNNEIMNALREVYKLLESVSKRIDVLMLDSNPGDYEKLSKRIGTITDDSDLRIVSKKELDEIFPTE